MRLVVLVCFFHRRACPLGSQTTNRIFNYARDIPQDLRNLDLWIHHDEDVQVFINGVQAAQLQGYATAYLNWAPNGPGQAALQAEKNLLAVHCHQTGGGQYIDVGFVEVIPAKQ
jgi:hypothetical protein